MNATTQLTVVDLPGVAQRLATARLDLVRVNRLVDVLVLGADVAERLVADVENVVRPVERVQRDLFELAVVDADEPAPVAVDERTLHDPLAVGNDEGGLLDDHVGTRVVQRVRAGLLAGFDVRVEHPPLLHER